MKGRCVECIFPYLLFIYWLLLVKMFQEPQSQTTPLLSLSEPQGAVRREMNDHLLLPPITNTLQMGLHLYRCIPQFQALVRNHSISISGNLS